MMGMFRGHWVAIVGGACAGSTAAAQMAAQGIQVAVFEQQALPFGKIEDGLPKWHVKLRDKEEMKIVQRLNHPNIHYIPRTRLGKDIDFMDLVKNWGFSAVLLASGAWRDRPLPVADIDQWLDRGFYYQNTFVEWFNHSHEPEYTGPVCRASDNAIVIGGGLASIDVVKILMLETVRAAALKKGIEIDVISLEHKGIASFLMEHQLTLNALGLSGCTLFYRRRAIDMPLASVPEGADSKRIEKVQQVRTKILNNAMKKYLFQFNECCLPVSGIVQNDQLAGMRFQKSRVVDGKVQPVDNSEFDVLSPLTISSIGSIPRPLSGIPSRGELFAVSDWNLGKIQGFPNVFALGNAVTGRGNIRESELHARAIADEVLKSYLKWDSETAERLQDMSDEEVLSNGMTSGEAGKQLLARIREAQVRAGYDGVLESWIAAHTPPRLENMAG